mgnify:CR=1 FL=1
MKIKITSLIPGEKWQPGWIVEIEPGRGAGRRRDPGSGAAPRNGRLGGVRQGPSQKRDESDGVGHNGSEREGQGVAAGGILEDADWAEVVDSLSARLSG